MIFYLRFFNSQEECLCEMDVAPEEFQAGQRSGSNRQFSSQLLLALGEF